MEKVNLGNKIQSADPLLIIVLEYHGQAGMESGNADFDSGMFVNTHIFYFIFSKR